MKNMAANFFGNIIFSLQVVFPFFKLKFPSNFQEGNLRINFPAII